MGDRQPSYQAGFYSPRRGGRPKYPGLWRGVVARWSPCLGPTGSVLRDTGREQAHGSFTNMDPATDWVVGPTGWELDLDGSDDYVDCGSTNLVNAITGPISAEAWVRFDDVTSDRWVVANVDIGIGTAFGFEFGIFGGSFAAFVFNGGFPDVTSATPPVAGQTYHLGFRASASGMALFLDGSLNVSNSKNAVSVASTVSTTIGARLRGGASGFVNGVIADVGVYDRLLTDNEFALLARRPGTACELVGRKVYSMPSTGAVRLRRILTGVT